ncbi:hypothetical protein BDN72DRAFT_903830 [Pluteus cervinus]|uniref:Uncharacterized protein n=1 Tax=Pluteus cervinus TaxID=181527 RepID=A0ACD3A7B5_9AGAR|nr:hypothetical protein BDN72DRAFT_903830 [Pluteus cervinus]
MARKHTIGRPSSVRGLYFPPFHSSIARTRVVGATVHPGHRVIPDYNSTFQGRRDIPVRESTVVVQYGGRVYSFRLAYRYHHIFLRNQALAEVCPETVWRGEMLVMQEGSFKSVVNIQRHDPARYAVRHFLLRMKDRLDQADTTGTIPQFIAEVDEA